MQIRLQNKNRDDKLHYKIKSNLNSNNAEAVDFKQKKQIFIFGTIDAVQFCQGIYFVF